MELTQIRVITSRRLNSEENNEIIDRFDYLPVDVDFNPMYPHMFKDEEMTNSITMIIVLALMYILALVSYLYMAKYVIESNSYITFEGLTVIGGAVGISHNLNSNHETTNAPISIQEVADNAQQFIDIDSDDLVWMETVSNNAGGTIELNENTIGQAGSITGFEEVSSVQMDWWQGQGDMYRAIDTDGNGTWDTASRLNPYTNESETIQLGEEDGSGATTMQEIQSQFDKAQ